MCFITAPQRFHLQEGLLNPEDEQVLQELPVPHNTTGYIYSLATVSLGLCCYHFKKSSTALMNMQKFN